MNFRNLPFSVGLYGYVNTFSCIHYVGQQPDTPTPHHYTLPPPGTGTVVVRVADQNDNPPSLARRRWEVEVEETPPAVPPPNTTLLELTAADRDATTSLHYRVSW